MSWRIILICCHIEWSWFLEVRLLHLIVASLFQISHQASCQRPSEVTMPYFVVRLELQRLMHCRAKHTETSYYTIKIKNSNLNISYLPTKKLTHTSLHLQPMALQFLFFKFGKKHVAKREKKKTRLDDKKYNITMSIILQAWALT